MTHLPPPHVPIITAPPATLGKKEDDGLWAGTGVLALLLFAMAAGFWLGLGWAEAGCYGG